MRKTTELWKLLLLHLKRYFCRVVCASNECHVPVMSDCFFKYSLCEINSCYAVQLVSKQARHPYKPCAIRHTEVGLCENVTIRFIPVCFQQNLWICSDDQCERLLNNARDGLFKRRPSNGEAETVKWGCDCFHGGTLR